LKACCCKAFVDCRMEKARAKHEAKFLPDWGAFLDVLLQGIRNVNVAHELHCAGPQKAAFNPSRFLRIEISS